MFYYVLEHLDDMNKDEDYTKITSRLVRPGASQARRRLYGGTKRSFGRWSKSHRLRAGFTNRHRNSSLWDALLLSEAAHQDSSWRAGRASEGAYIQRIVDHARVTPVNLGFRED